jgi:hypothetical protein
MAQRRLFPLLRGFGGHQVRDVAPKRPRRQRDRLVQAIGQDLDGMAETFVISERDRA